MGDVEVWRNIDENGHYRISSMGRVESVKRFANGRNTSGRIMKLKPDKRGYLNVNITLDGEKVTKKVHRLVAEAFIPNPEKKPTVNHKNGIKQDNNLSNLEWHTWDENKNHAVENKLMRGLRGEDSPRSKISKEMAIEIKKRLSQNERPVRISRSLRVSEAIVVKIKTGKTWVHLGGGW